MRQWLHNPVPRLLMAVLVVLLSWPCAGRCADGELSGAGSTSFHSASAAPGITVGHHHDHHCDCPCLSDTVKVGAERTLYVPLLPPTLPVAILEPPQPPTLVLPFRDDVLPPTPRTVLSSTGLRAPPFA